MQEGMLSRRPPPGSPEGREDDGAKTRKPTSHLGRFTARLFNFRSEDHYLGHPLAISLLLLLLIVALLLVLDLSRPAVCISSFSHTSLFSAGVDRLSSNFGSLGVPWCRSKQGKTVDWTTKDLLKGLEEFVPIYERRPIKNNIHGMGFDHSFGLWFMARWLKPDLMIESGAFKGHSTWVLRQAMPNKPIISISPRHPEKYLKKEPAYVDGNCTYFAGKNFVDFGSVEWDNVLRKQGILDFSRVLVFFDDHQSELKRLKQALKAGFRHLIFEDNYDTGTGDHYSLRQICDQAYIRGGGHSCVRDSDEARIRKKRNMFWEKAVEIDDLCGKGEAWWGVRGEMRDDFNHSNKAITYDEHFQYGGFIESVLDVYWELPPIAGPSLTHQTRYDPGRAPDPIIEDGSFGLFQRHVKYQYNRTRRAALARHPPHGLGAAPAARPWLCSPCAALACSPCAALTVQPLPHDPVVQRIKRWDSDRGRQACGGDVGRRRRSCSGGDYSDQNMRTPRICTIRLSIASSSGRTVWPILYDFSWSPSLEG